MRTEIIMNGTIKVVLIPENELEIAALSMLSKQDVEVQYIDKVTQILDKQVDKYLSIKPRSRTDSE